MANITNEVLAEKIDSVNLRLGGVEKKIDNMPAAFVSHEVLELKLAPITTKLVELAQKKNIVAWGIPIFCTVIGSVFTFLIISYIQGDMK